MGLAATSIAKAKMAVATTMATSAKAFVMVGWGAVAAMASMGLDRHFRP